MLLQCKPVRHTLSKCERKLDGAANDRTLTESDETVTWFQSECMAQLTEQWRDLMTQRRDGAVWICPNYAPRHRLATSRHVTIPSEFLQCIQVNLFTPNNSSPSRHHHPITAPEPHHHPAITSQHVMRRWWRSGAVWTRGTANRTLTKLDGTAVRWRRSVIQL